MLQVLCEAHSPPHEQTIHYLLSNMDLGLIYRQILLGVYLKLCEFMVEPFTFFKDYLILKGCM